MKKWLLALTFIIIAGFGSLIYFLEEAPVGQAEASFDKETDRVIVEMTDTSGNEVVESVSAEELQQFNDGLIPDKSSILHAAANIKVLEPDYIRSAGPLLESKKVLSWGTTRVGANKMVQQVNTLKGTVIIAVIDTGVDYNHLLLKGRIVKGFDFVDNKADSMDVNDHGTHVAGIIAESTPENVKIMPIRALDKKGDGYDSHVVKSIHYAVKNGAKVINLSLSGQQYSNHLAEAIKYALSKNVLVVIAAGNNGSDTTKYYPSSDSNAIIVSATDKSDKIAKFSNTGATVDLSAPGVEIISSVRGGKYAVMSGTSMSAPYVSSVAAMMRLAYPKADNIAVEKLVKKYVDDRGAKGWDPLYGEGIINVATYDEKPIIQNKVPVVNSEKRVFKTEKGKAITLDLLRFVSDPDGDKLTFTADNGKLSVNSLTFKTQMIGEHIITITATDGKSKPVSFELLINVESIDEVGDSKPPTEPSFVLIPEQKEITLDTVWSIKFTRKITEKNVVDIKLYLGETEVPITLQSNIEEKEIIASPVSHFEPASSYRLVIFIEKGKSYEMLFETQKIVD